jgi:hypothetical protein
MTIRKKHYPLITSETLGWGMTLCVKFLELGRFAEKPIDITCQTCMYKFYVWREGEKEYEETYTKNITFV